MGHSLTLIERKTVGSFEHHHVDHDFVVSGITEDEMKTLFNRIKGISKNNMHLSLERLEVAEDGKINTLMGFMCCRLDRLYKIMVTLAIENNFVESLIAAKFLDKVDIIALPDSEPQLHFIIID
jgi:hypothetical protein